MLVGAIEPVSKVDPALAPEAHATVSSARGKVSPKKAEGKMYKPGGN